MITVAMLISSNIISFKVKIFSFFAAPYSLSSSSPAQRTLNVQWTKPVYKYAEANATGGSDALLGNTSTVFNATCISNGNPTVKGNFEYTVTPVGVIVAQCIFSMKRNIVGGLSMSAFTSVSSQRL